MLDDQELLRTYTEEGSDAAFGHLVSRYVNLVHSAALRRVGGNVELARDVAQIVFTDLAAKARWLPRNVVLAGWLHRATRFAAGHVKRAEHRRKAREKKAALMNSIESESAPDWDRISPMLDAALDALPSTDREVLVLRFFEQHNLAKVGQLLGLSEDAARKRVSRALEKLRTKLARNGTAVTATALVAAVSANAVKAAPAGMAVQLSTAALAGAAAKAGTLLTLLKIMTMTKLKFLIVGGVVIVGITTPLIVQHRAQLKLRETNPPSEASSAKATHTPEYFQQLHRLAAGKERDVKALGLVFHLYAIEHNDQFPTTMEAVTPYFAKENVSLTGTNDIELFYKGPLAELGTNPSQGQMILFRDKQTWAGPEGKPTRVYGMADGSVQTIESDDNFRAWEAAHAFSQQNANQ